MQGAATGPACLMVLFSSSHEARLVTSTKGELKKQIGNTRQKGHATVRASQVSRVGVRGAAPFHGGGKAARQRAAPLPAKMKEGNNVTGASHWQRLPPQAGRAGRPLWPNRPSSKTRFWMYSVGRLHTR